MSSVKKNQSWFDPDWSFVFYKHCITPRSWHMCHHSHVCSSEVLVRLQLVAIIGNWMHLTGCRDHRRSGKLGAGSWEVTTYVGNLIYQPIASIALSDILNTSS
jgi:uncharacterized membrane protein YozB (DUF420 family)